MILALLAQVVTAGVSFECTPIKVWDGDGPIWCAEGPRIRLGGIAAREMDETCKPGHPCPAASGVAARDGLVKLLGGKRGVAGTGHIIVSGPRLTCWSDGSAGRDRTAAWCSSRSTGSLNCAMVATRLVVRWPRYWREGRC